MNDTIIKNATDLHNYISNYTDYNPDVTYLSCNENDECFAIYGCTYATEAFNFIAGDKFYLVITDDDYSAEIDKQERSDYPEMNGFYMRAESHQITANFK